jgi:hypothetical protein
VLTGQGAWQARKHDAKPCKYAKTHVLNGVNTRATLAVTFTRGHRHDTQELPDLVDAVPEHAPLHALLRDKVLDARQRSTRQERRPATVRQA